MVDSWPKAIYLCNRECVLCGKIDQIRLCWSENEFGMPVGLFVSGGWRPKGRPALKMIQQVAPSCQTSASDMRNISTSKWHRGIMKTQVFLHSFWVQIMWHYTQVAHFLQGTQKTDVCMTINTLLWLWNIDVEIIWAKYFHDIIVTFNSQVVLLFCGGKLWFLLPCFPLPKLFSIPNKCVPNEVSD